MFTVLFMVLIPVVLMAADAVTAVSAPDAALTLQTMPTWVVNNQVIIGALIVALLDFIFALNGKWKSNGALHWLYVLALKIVGKG